MLGGTTVHCRGHQSCIGILTMTMGVTLGEKSLLGELWYG